MVVGIFSKKFKIPLKTLLKTIKNLPKDVFLKKKTFFTIFDEKLKKLSCRPFRGSFSNLKVILWVLEGFLS
jgi:hypothetical protein